MGPHKDWFASDFRYIVVERRLRRYTPCAEDAEDAVQHAALALLSWRPQTKPRLPANEMEAFITVAGKRYLCGLRRRKQRFSVVAFEEAATEPCFVQSVNSVDSLLVKVALDTLPTSERTLLLLHGEGNTCEQLSVQLAVSTEAVKKRIQRARSRFRSALIDVGYGDPLNR